MSAHFLLQAIFHLFTLRLFAISKRFRDIQSLAITNLLFSFVNLLFLLFVLILHVFVFLFFLIVHVWHEHFWPAACAAGLMELFTWSAEGGVKRRRSPDVSLGENHNKPDVTRPCDGMKNIVVFFFCCFSSTGRIKLRPKIFFLNL